MNKEFVSYEIALELRKLGFDEYVLEYYNTETKDFCDVMKEVKAPLYQQAFRWFREKYEIHTKINPHLSNDGNDNYIVDEYDWEILHPKYFDGSSFEKYEDAQIDCLNKLIEIVKEKND